MPQDWPAFRRYFEEMVSSANLHVGATARTLGHQVLAPTRRSAVPMYTLVGAMTAGLMPPALRDAYGIPYSNRHRLLFQGAVWTARKGLPALPDAVRYCPAYLSARRRVAGESGSDPVSLSWKRLVLALLRQRD